jgi:hypothetical protein
MFYNPGSGLLYDKTFYGGNNYTLGLYHKTLRIYNLESSLFSVTFTSMDKHTRLAFKP